MIPPSVQVHSISIISEVVGCLSVVGCVVIILTYLVFRDQQQRSQQLLVFLSVADLGQALFFSPLSYAVGNTTRTTCIIQGSLGLVSAPASFLWTMCIAYYVNMVIRCVIVEERFEGRLITFFHLISWGYPAALLASLFIIDPGVIQTEDEATDWCGIPTKYWQWRTAFVFGPLLVSIAVTVVLYLWSRNLLRRQIQTSKTNVAHVKMVLIPLIYVLCRIWGVLYFSLTFYYDDSEGFMFIILILRAIGDPGQGFFNSVVFVLFNKKARLRWKALCKSRTEDESALFQGSVQYGGTYH